MSCIIALAHDRPLWAATITQLLGLNSVEAWMIVLCGQFPLGCVSSSRLLPAAASP